MSDDDDGAAHAARAVTWIEAMRLSGHDNMVAAALSRTAELTVLRRLVSAHLAGGEIAYWQLVAEELRQ